MPDEMQAQDNSQVEVPVAEAKEDKKTKKKVKKVERNEPTTLHERTIATLSYISFLAIVPFYLKKDSDFCRHHGKQGMLLAIMFFIASILTVIDFISDLVIIIQVLIFFRMGFAALTGRWKQLPFFYEAACQLEGSLTLKTKEEEMGFDGLKPNEVPNDDTGQSLGESSTQ